MRPSTPAVRAGHARTPLLVGLVLGGLVAGLISLVVFYDRPGRAAVNRLLVEAGLRPSSGVPHAFDAEGFRKERSAVGRWPGVLSPDSPQWKVRRGLDVSADAAGFTYPVNIAFVPKPSEEPDAPLYYVNELNGTIKYVTRDRQIHTYATGLTNFAPDFSHKTLVYTSMMGLSGLMVVPETGDLLVTGAYRDEASGLIKNRLLHLVSEDGGRRASKVRVLFAPDEFTGPAHHIHQVLVGTDGKLLVSVGDATYYAYSLDASRFAGKILRLEPDGSACRDNPRFAPEAPTAPVSYLFADGFRNAFDFDLHPQTGELYAVDSGQDLDRVVRVLPGSSYGWNGDPDSIRINALYTWGPLDTSTPAGVTFLRRPVLGVGTDGRLYVALFGPDDLGPNHGKALVELLVDGETGMLRAAPETILQYVGEHQATVLGVAEGPDGLYFTDFFGESDVPGHRGSGAVWRLFASAATLDRPLLDEAAATGSAVERGRAAFSRSCAGCHRLDGVGGREGPDLSGVATKLERWLHTRAYEATVRALLESPATFVRAQRPRLTEVLDRSGKERVHAWLSHHLVEPRFDNPHARMPSFERLAAAERADIIELLLAQTVAIDVDTKQDD